MSQFKILIVEDEILIADTIKRYLVRADYDVLDICISYEEAIESYKDGKPDLVLLDIRLNGPKTGIDVAKYILAQERPCPFVYLTSQIDASTLELAKETNPDGYLPKPIRKDTLLTTVEITIHNHISKTTNSVSLIFSEGNNKYNVNSEDIMFIQADHIYVEIILKGGQKIIQRSTIKELLTDLPVSEFIQTHRSFIVNKNYVDVWNNSSLNIEEYVIPVSRSRKKDVFSKLSQA